MFKSLVSLVVMAALVLVGLVLTPTRAEARRCGEKEPETLLSLYRKSEGIHVARYDGQYEVGVIEDDEDFQVIEKRLQFTVLRTLKGEARKFIEVSESEYKYKGEYSEEPGEASGEPTVEEEPAEGEGHYDEMELYGRPKLEAGDEVIIFVKTNEEDGKIILTDYSDAVKKLESDEMAIVERALIDLDGIFASQEVSPAEVTAWLVRLTEESATRWDGAYELLAGQRSIEWRQERENTIKGKQARGEQLEEWEREMFDYEVEELGYSRADLARALTDSQKQAMLEIVLRDGFFKTLNRSEDETEDAGDPAVENAGDATMVELVGLWGDSRLALALYEQIRTGSREVYQDVRLMESVSSILKDPLLSAIVSSYARVAWDGADDLVAESDIPATEVQMAFSGGEPLVYPVEFMEGEYGIGVSATLTYKELREDLRAKFFARCEILMTTAR
jgi:hypothetical protein